MIRELEGRMKIVAHNTTARVFAAGVNAAYWYPYKLLPAHEANRPSVRDSCFELIVDSGYTQDELTNKDVIEAAADIGADYLMMKDAPGDQRATHHALEDFIELYNDHVDCAAKPFVVLQPPYREHYQQYEDVYSRFSHFALGGLHQFDPWQQLGAIRQFRDAAGGQVHVHALGIGTDLEVIRGLRQEPRLIDSLDVSTAETAIKNNKIPDKTWKQTRFYIPTGVSSGDVRARFASAILDMLNFCLSDLVDDEELEGEYQEQTVLGEVAELQKQETLASYRGSDPDRYDERRDLHSRD